MKFITIKRAIFSLLVILPINSAMAIDTSAVSKITLVNTYGAASTTVYFKIATPTANCTAYYISDATLPGYDLNVSSIIAAFHGQKNVVVNANTTQLWGGSSAPTCRLTTLSVRE